MSETPGAPRVRDDGSPLLRPDARDADVASTRGWGGSGQETSLYGALDLGTNNCRLLIAKPAREGFRVVDSFSRIVRLGDGLSLTGRLDDAAMDRAYDALMTCSERVARRGLDSGRLMAVATQACRQATNGEAFLERVRKGTGLKLRVITPEEEAELSVIGCMNLFDRKAEAVLVVDVGGGSTELSWMVRQGKTFRSHGWMSVPMGVVTLAERHPEPDDPSPTRIDDWFEAMVKDMGQALRQGPVPDDLRPLFGTHRAHLVGTSGAITSLAGVHLRLSRYQRNRVDGLWMNRADCERATRDLIEMGPAGRANQPCIGPERADLVLAGAAIMEAVQRQWPSDRVRVADRGLREGLLLKRIRQDRPNRRRRRGKARDEAG